MTGAPAPGELEYHVLDVFTDVPGGGNPLAVFVDAPALPDSRMQAIAFQLGLSETVFVLPATLPGAQRRLRIFTPAMELPFAGHPTIGTAQLLVDLGLVEAESPGVWRFSLQEQVGAIPVEVTTKDTGSGRFTWLTTSQLPQRGPAPPRTEVLAALLGIDAAEIATDARDAPSAYSAGVPFLFVPLRDRSVLGRARVNGDVWTTHVAGFWAPHIFAFVPPDGADAGGREVAARMFAPAMGIVEDPATGAAAAALAGYLWDRERTPGRWIVMQGREMGRPSELHVELRGAGPSLERVRVGGGAVHVRTERLTTSAA